MGLKFRFGTVVATPGVVDLIEGGALNWNALLARHGRGDWGEMEVEDREANDAALTNGARIFSRYDVEDAPGGRVWVITEAVNDDGRRASTCLLLPDEY